MKVEFGKIVNNKTKMFLSPILRTFGVTFTAKFSGDIFKLGYGIHDTLLDGVFDGKHPIYIACDKGVNPQKCWKAIEFIKEHSPGYLTDYSMDTGSRLHMLVLDIPLEYHHAYDKFKEGKYSEMFTKQQLDLLFPDKSLIAYKILSKDVSYMPIFIKKIEDLFNVKIEDKTNYITSELEFPYRMCKELEQLEVFNYKI